MEERYIKDAPFPEVSHVESVMMGYKQRKETSAFQES